MHIEEMGTVAVSVVHIVGRFLIIADVLEQGGNDLLEGLGKGIAFRLGSGLGPIHRGRIPGFGQFTFQCPDRVSRMEPISSRLGEVAEFLRMVAKEHGSNGAQREQQQAKIGKHRLPPFSAASGQNHHHSKISHGTAQGIAEQVIHIKDTSGKGQL